MDDVRIDVIQATKKAFQVCCRPVLDAYVVPKFGALDFVLDMMKLRIDTERIIF
jgi:hypothetical protein